MPRVIISVLVLLVLAPAPSYAWGAAAHRYIMARAIDLLPAEIKPFFTHNRDELVVRVNDPDKWRNVGWEDDPNHFLDLGAPEFGPFPFTALPREQGAALEKFGFATIKRDGTLPWRVAEEAGNLRRAFEGMPTNVAYSPDNAVLFTAVAAHYLQDAHQPFHATINHDGQLTGQIGIHSRFETAVFVQYRAQLAIHPKPAAPMKNPRDAAFDALLAGYQLVQPVLDADKDAIAGKDAYDDEYYDRFFAKVKPILERQIADAITATVAMIEGMWEEAGRPALKTELPRTVQKVRGPRGQ